MAGAHLRVLVVDDHVGVGDAIAGRLGTLEDFEVVGVSSGIEEAARLAASSRPDLALVHARIRGGGGAAATKAILEGSPATGVVAHAALSDREGVTEMMRAGACGQLVRGAPETDLAGALRDAGRGVVPARREDSSERRRRIERALEPGGMEILFQPIVHLGTREVIGHEALARFADEPERAPQLWFRDAEEVGLGLELELAAVRLACERATDLPAETFLAVNVSPATAESPELRALLEEAQVAHVVLEVTEHAPVEDYRRFRSALARMRASGARLAVEDAGAGFASLRHIVELDAEVIKLDASLTSSLDADLRRRSLASALIEYGHETGASVLAEGIDSELQVSELRRLGVRYGQGFHLGPPRPALRA